MIRELKMLLRVRELKKEQAFRALQAKRGEVEDAKRETEAARAAVDESAETLPARKDAIFVKVLGRVVDQTALDDARNDVVELDRQHMELKDALDRAAHVQHRLEQELEAAVARHRTAEKAKDKFAIITDEAVQNQQAELTLKEENEVEELFSKPMKRVA